MNPQTRERATWLALVFLLGGIALYQYATRPVTRFTAPDLTDEELATLADFHKLSYFNTETWRKNTWLGVPAQQNPNDAWIIQEILQEVKPDFLVEAGTAEGGSAALWATVLEQVNPEARVITIDIVDMTETVHALPVVQRRVDFLLGSSTDPEIVAEVGRRVEGKRVVVILDSDHSKAHVLEELKIYSQWVGPGSYLIVQDTNLNGHPVHVEGFGEGPMEALDEFLKTNDQFEVDTSRERLLFTLHPRGYLRRRG